MNAQLAGARRGGLGFGLLQAFRREFQAKDFNPGALENLRRSQQAEAPAVCALADRLAASWQAAFRRATARETTPVPVPDFEGFLLDLSLEAVGVCLIDAGLSASVPETEPTDEDDTDDEDGAAGDDEGEPLTGAAVLRQLELQPAALMQTAIPRESVIGQLADLLMRASWEPATEADPDAGRRRREHCRVLAGLALEQLPAAVNQRIDWSQSAKRAEHLLKLDPAIAVWLQQWAIRAALRATPAPLRSPPKPEVSAAASTDLLGATGRSLPRLRYRRNNEVLHQYAASRRGPWNEEPVRAVIDRHQAVRWRINRDVLEVADALQQLARGNETGLAGGDASTHAHWRAFAQSLFQSRSKRERPPGEMLDNPLVRSVLAEAVPGAEPLPFHLAVRIDYRGRVVYDTPFFSPQGGDLPRSLLEFADGQPVQSDPGRRALKRHGANLVPGRTVLADLGIVGRPRVTLQDREDWVDRQEARIRAVAANPFAEPWWSTVASGKKRWQFLAFCRAYARVLEHPEQPCHLPVQIDGTCNGLQHIAALLGCPDLARAVNLCPAEDKLPQDIYAETAAAAAQLLPTHLEAERRELEQDFRALEALDLQAVTAAQLPNWMASAPRGLSRAAKKLAAAVRKTLKEQGLANPALTAWKAEALAELPRQQAGLVRRQQALELLAQGHFPLDREIAKPVIMTIPYGAGVKAQTENLAENLVEKLEKLASERAGVLPLAGAAPTDPKAQRAAARERMRLAQQIAAPLVAVLRQALDQRFPRLKAFAGYLRQVASAQKPLPLLWTAPTGLPVLQDGFRVKRADWQFSIFEGRPLVLRRQQMTEDVDGSQQQRQLLPNLIHSLDAAHLWRTLAALARDGVHRFGSIHDCLLVHPEDAETLGHCLRQAFAAQYKQDHEGRRPIWWTTWTHGAELRAALVRVGRVDGMTALDQLLSERDPSSVDVRAYLEHYQPRSRGCNLPPPLSEALRALPDSDFLDLHFQFRHWGGEKPDREINLTLPEVPEPRWQPDQVLDSPYFFC
ncbi:MAG: hypothetical protein MUE46_19010 [Xanthomonadales bacterium]|nr:hypothetical protein [Xanthomonadales bacterium]